MRTIGVGCKIAGFMLALTSFSILLSNYSVYAEESSVSTATVTINQSCSMSGTTNTAHTATLANGTYSGSNYPTGIGQTTLKVFCNDNAGFAIYAIGYTGNEYGNTKLHNDTLGSTYDISTGIYTSGTTINSTWSMKLASVSGTYAPTISDGTNNTENFTTWHEIPTEYTKVAYRTSTTDADNNGQGTGSSLTTTYDAYVSATQPAGTYIGQVKYTLVHPNKVDNSNKPVAPMASTDCLANEVCYAPNASDIDGTMISDSHGQPTLTAISSKYPTAAKQTYTVDDSGTASAISASTTSITLIAPNYKRAGYGFAGWSTNFEADNSSTIYGPNETITIEAGSLSTNGMILYPVWIASTGNLQGWNGCNSLTQATYDSTNNKMVATLSSVTALTDTRDGNVYTVARLADDQCWMVENLRLNNTVSAATMASGSQGIGGVFTSLPQSVDATWDSNTSNNLYAGLTAYTLPQLNTNNTNIDGKNASDTDLIPGYNTNDIKNAQWYSYGNYYSWAAAIADTTVYDSDNGHATVETSICPTGWHLPYGNNGNSSPNLGNTAGGFYYLNQQMGKNTSIQGSKDWRSFPNNFIYSGRWNGSYANSRGDGGYYWSSSAYYSSGTYSLRFNGYNVYPTNKSSSKSLGFSVRCVAGGSGS